MKNKILEYKKLYDIPVRFQKEVIKYGGKIIIGVSAKAIPFQTKSKKWN
jgi:hypothetical protein